MASDMPRPSGRGQVGGDGTQPDGSLPTGRPSGAEGVDETEPDARFTFANERTFLAWHRTALALVVAGLAIVQFLPPFPVSRSAVTCSLFR